MINKEIETKIKELPDELKREVLDYIEFLTNKYKLKKKKRKRSFKFDWEGGLEELKDKFTSVELQYKSKE